MKVEDVRKCSFEKWYNAFTKVTIKSIILPLPDGFTSYILKDGIFLPKSKEQCIAKRNSSDSEEEEVWEDSEEADVSEVPHFADFDKSIQDAIKTLGGKVFPKLNWSSPQDASWISFNNSCCCESVSDVYLLLKSSDFIVHDLTQRFLKCEDFVTDEESNKLMPDQEVEKFYLILRKWREIDTSGEFRCFIVNNTLIGISQREPSAYFEHIGRYKSDIVEDIVSFYQTHIHLKFPATNYVFDVYRRIKGRVCLIDFNPFGSVTDSLLFSWDELNSDSIKVDENRLPEFRFVDDNHGVQPRSLSYHAVPRDIVDISTGEDSFKLVDLLKMKIDEQKSSEDDENI
ncbi:hypothetical protein JTE90_012683 [Oedothorax gibbosus]|uniref:Cell division cycle protein 123 homolog n=1 Tax=Oedothorax gibbosus TaxID=931172 RepID=A0AAV6VX76_9ARAC|nr:hypothetical protein JTE90_012683 [Oedothorax gibbosus]